MYKIVAAVLFYVQFAQATSCAHLEEFRKDLETYNQSTFPEDLKKLEKTVPRLEDNSDLKELFTRVQQTKLKCKTKSGKRLIFVISDLEAKYNGHIDSVKSKIMEFRNTLNKIEETVSHILPKCNDGEAECAIKYLEWEIKNLKQDIQVAINDYLNLSKSKSSTLYYKYNKLFDEC